MTTRRPMQKGLAVGCALALVLALGACGNDSDGDDEAATTTEAAAETTTTSTDDTDTTETTEGSEGEEPDVAEAQALAESVNLTLDDFAEGWTEEPASDEEGEVTKCFQDVDTDEVEVASAKSPTFSIAEPGGAKGQVVSLSTIVTDDADSATSIVEEAGGETFAACAGDALVASLEQDGTEVTTEGFDPLDGADELGDGGAGLTSAITVVAADGTEAGGQVALAFLRTENVVTAMTLLDLGDIAFESTLQELLTQVAANHEAEIG